MARVPTVQADEATMTPGAFRPTSGREFGAVSGEALEQLGATIRDAATQVGQTYEETRARQSVTEAHKELNDYSLYLKNGPVNDGSQTDALGEPLPVGSPQMDSATGLPVGPPPPEEHAQLMQQKIDDLKEKYGDFGPLGGRANHMFQSEFGNYSNAQLLETKSHALTLMRQKTATGFLFDQNQRANLAVSSEPLVRHTAEHENETYINAMVDRGLLTPEQGLNAKERFAEQVEVGSARMMLKQPLRKDNTDGASDLMLAIDKGEFDTVNAAVKERIYNQAFTQHISNIKQQQNGEMHDITMREKRAREASRVTSLKLIQAYGQNKLTMQMVQDSSGRLMPEAAEMLTKLAAGGAGPSNKFLEFALRDRMMSGDDVHEDTVAAVNNGSVSPERGSQILKENSQFSALKHDNDFQSEWSWLKTQFVTDSVSKIPAQAAASAESIRNLQEWRKQHRTATPNEMHDFAQELVRRNSIVNPSEMVTTLSSPAYGKSKAEILSGAASWEDMQQAAQTTQSKYEKGEIDLKKRNTELALIHNWTQNLNLKPKAAGTVKK